MFPGVSASFPSQRSLAGFMLEHPRDLSGKPCQNGGGLVRGSAPSRRRWRPQCGIQHPRHRQGSDSASKSPVSFSRTGLPWLLAAVHRPSPPLSAIQIFPQRRFGAVSEWPPHSRNTTRTVYLSRRDFSRKVKQGKAVLFIGAGASHAAGAPLGAELAAYIHQEFLPGVPDPAQDLTEVCAKVLDTVAGTLTK